VRPLCRAALAVHRTRRATLAVRRRRAPFAAHPAAPLFRRRGFARPSRARVRRPTH